MFTIVVVKSNTINVLYIFILTLKNPLERSQHQPIHFAVKAIFHKTTCAVTGFLIETMTAEVGWKTPVTDRRVRIDTERKEEGKDDNINSRHVMHNMPGHDLPWSEENCTVSH